jgi:metal-sulfur cluster biosynthetic enzyme
MTDKTIEKIASDAADTASPDDAASPASLTGSTRAGSAGVGSADAGSAAGADSAEVVVSKASIDDIEEAMKDVVDPELGINVVDLGLVYGAFVDDDNVVTLDMTLTSAACPLTDVIEDQTRQALTTGPGGGLVNDFRINWVWLPPWGPDKITDDGREQLRALGFNV